MPRVRPAVLLLVATVVATFTGGVVSPAVAVPFSGADVLVLHSTRENVADLVADTSSGGHVAAVWVSDTQDRIHLSGGPADDGTGRSVFVNSAETLTVGTHDAAGRLDWNSAAGCDAASKGRLVVSELQRAADGALARFAASWDLTDCEGVRHIGLVRWKSNLPYAALGLDPRLELASAAEVGSVSSTRVVVTNRGSQPAADLRAVVDGSGGADWTVDDSDCSGAPLAAGASCELTVGFAPTTTDARDATLSVIAPDAPSSYRLSLRGTGVGQPSPPTGVRAEASAFGVVVTWEDPLRWGGSVPASATISKSDDEGVTWRNLATVSDHRLVQRRYPDPTGLLAGATPKYRVQVTQAPRIEGQTHTYTSVPSAPATAGLARESILVDTQVRIDGSLTNIRGSMSATHPRPGYFLPSHFRGPWAQSPEGDEVVMGADGGPVETPYRLVRLPATGSSTRAGTVAVSRPFPIEEVAWSPDGQRLAWREYHREGSYSELAWASASGASMVLSGNRSLSRVAWLPDSRTLVGVDTGRLAFLDTLTKTLTSTTISAQDVALTPDASRLVVLTTSENGVDTFFDVHPLDPNRPAVTGPAMRTVVPSRNIVTMSSAPDGRELLLGTPRGLLRAPLGTDGRVGELVPVDTDGGDISRATWHSLRPRVTVSGQPGVSRASVTIGSAGMAPGVAYRCGVDGGPTAACSTGWTTPSLPSGRHTVAVVATEPSGRSTTTARTWVVSLAEGTGFFTPVAPARVLDTRLGIGAPRAKIGAGKTVTLTIPGLPSDTTAAVLNVTAANPTAHGYVTAYPAAGTRPSTSNLNLTAGRNVANLVSVRVSANRVTFYNNAGSTDVIADLAGYFAPSRGAGYTSRDPQRVLDTRTGLGVPRARVGARESLTLTLPGLPVNTTAVTLNVTAVAPTSPTYVTVHPADTNRPSASNLNVVTGETRANLVTVKVGSGNRITLYNDAGATDLLVDLAGHFATSSGLPYTAKTPVRVLDTRIGLGAPKAAVAGGSSIALTIPGLPAAATGAVLNMTGVSPDQTTFLTVRPPTQTRPTASSINLRAGTTVPNLVSSPVGTGRRLGIYNDRGGIHVLGDLAGWFAP
ncbi:hypothetical protein Q9R29_14845 [Rothia sp. ARF10]|nr:hypothetical protein [Rothia sp. ARF10]